MWVEQTAASGAAKAGPRNERVRVAEDMPAHMLLLASPSADLAAELSVEGVEGLLLGRQFVGVPLDELASELLIHWFEDHDSSLTLVA